MKGLFMTPSGSRTVTKLEGMGLETGQLGWKVVSKYLPHQAGDGGENET